MNRDVIPHYVARFAQLLGFLDEKKYRDFCIREEFDQLRKIDKLKVEEIEIKLAQKYSMQQDTIHKIIYIKD